MMIFKQLLISNNQSRVSRRHYSDIKSKLVRINLTMRNNKMQTLKQMQEQVDKESAVVDIAYVVFIVVSMIGLIIVI